MTRVGVAGAVIATLLATPVATLPVVGPADVTAAAQAGGASPARVALAAIPPWIEAGSAVSIDLRIEPVTEDLEVVANIHPPTTSRTAFERSVAGEGLGPPLGTVAVPIDELEAGPVGTHRLTIDLSAETTDPDLPSIPVTEVGVHPLSIQLRVAGAEAPTDSLVSHLVVLNEDAPPARLAVAWIWPIEVDGALAPDGRPAPALDEAVAPAGHLAQFTDALGNAPDIPVTLAPTPATIDAWTLLAAGSDDVSETTAGPEGGGPSVLATQRLDTLRAAVALPSRQVLAGPYAPTDFTSLVDAGLETEVGRQLARGADVLRDVLAIRPDPRTFMGSHLDAPTLVALRDAGVDRLVVEPALLEPVFSNLTLARPFELRSSGRTFDTAVVDATLSQLLLPPDADGESTADQPSEAALAQRLLAGLVTVALEAPGEERGVVVAAPATWNPSANLLVTVLQGMTGHPALRPVTVDAFFGRVDPAGGDTAARTLSAASPEGLRVPTDRIREVRRRIDSLVSMAGEDGSEVATADRLLLLATAAAPRSATTAVEYLEGVDTVIGEVAAAVRLPSEPSVTLTAPRARIPISFVNDSGSTLRVQVRLNSDRLLFPDGETHDVELPPRTSTLQFTVEARTSGSFPMSVEVTSPDGRLLVGSLTMTVRSTAVSGVALALTVGAGVFLVGWWGNHIRKARRARRAGVGPDEPPGRGDGS